MDTLGREFEAVILDFCKRSKAECGYNPTYFLRMLGELGAIETARRLVSTAVPSDGYTNMWEMGRLDITVEAAVVDPRFAALFTPEEIRKAKDRLDEYDPDGTLRAPKPREV